eukprot:5613515-Pleurochrysis_carterae.AAC.2
MDHKLNSAYAKSLFSISLDAHQARALGQCEARALCSAERAAPRPGQNRRRARGAVARERAETAAEVARAWAQGQ